MGLDQYGYGLAKGRTPNKMGHSSGLVQQEACYRTRQCVMVQRQLRGSLIIDFNTGRDYSGHGVSSGQPRPELVSH